MEQSDIDSNDLLPCPFCGGQPVMGLTDPGAPHPGGYFEIWCDNEDCPANANVCEKRRTDLKGMTHQKAEKAIWPEIIQMWNTRKGNERK